MLFNLVGKKMNYTLTPSLEQAALVKITATLWNQDDIRVLVSKFYFPLLGSERRVTSWYEIENKVIEKVSRLSQPVSLKEKILHFIKPVGLQILNLMEYHVKHCYLAIDLPKELFWTSQGTVDKKRTVEALIKNDSLDIARRYKLACIYCLEDDILELWNQIPESRRKSFYCEEDPRKVGQQELVALWTYDIEGEVDKLDNMIERRCQSECSPYQYAFEYAAVGGNKAATECFLQKLTPQEREKSLVRSAGYVANRHCISANSRTKEHYADVLCFLLSQMDEEQQIEVLKSYPYEVLECLLDWPWQSLFMEVTNRMWGFLSKEYFDFLLRTIVEKVKDGYKDCDYQRLIGEFWKQSPGAHKRYVIGKSLSRGYLLSDLMTIEDTENVRLIFKNATVKDKEKIIFQSKGMYICANLIYRDRWDLLKFFVQECIPFTDVIIKFKEKFKKHIIRHRSEEKIEKEKDMWNKAFQFLDDLAQENVKKKNMEEGECSPAFVV